LGLASLIAAIAGSVGRRLTKARTTNVLAPLKSPASSREWIKKRHPASAFRPRVAVSEPSRSAIHVFGDHANLLREIRPD
jgi:hypothetical protein